MNSYENISLVSPKNTALHSPCEEVKDIEGEVRGFIPYLIRIMRKEDGVGITANQVGINKAIFITNIPGDYIRIYINPYIRALGGEAIKTREGCLSYPGKLLTVQRKRHVIIHALNLKGEQFVINTTNPIYNDKVSAFLSVCLQHEIDHINGIDMREYM